MGFIEGIFGGGKVTTPEPQIIPAAPVERDPLQAERDEALRLRRRRAAQNRLADLRVQPGTPQSSQTGLSVASPEP